MKNKVGTLILIALLISFQNGMTQEPADPTVPSDKVSDALKSRLIEFQGISLRALVVGEKNDGIAVISTSREAGPLFVVRSGSSIAQELSGIPVRLSIKKVSPQGVEIETPTIAEELIIPGELKPAPYSEAVTNGMLQHMECTQLPLEQVLRLIADQTGANLSASKAAANEPVSVYLRNVSVETVVEEICRARSLWFRRDDASGIIRVTTMGEYEQGLTSFREEQTKSFTLLYPNVIEVASVIYGLYPDRVMLSLGESEILDDESNDISRRFTRFNTIAESGSSSFLAMTPGTSGGGTHGGSSGIFSYRGGNLDRLETGRGMDRQSRQTFTGLTSEGAKQLTEILQSGTNAIPGEVSAFQNKNASIYVTVSRRNNMIIVRTGDPQDMKDITELIRRLDMPAPMVLLEVKILQVALTDAFNSTFEYLYTKDFNTTGGKPVRTVTGFPGFTSLETEPRSDAMSFQLLSDHLAMRIQLMEEQGVATTLATPTLLTANNEISRLFIGERRPFVRNVTSQTIVSDSATITSPQVELDFQDVGTMLLITPNINADRTVTLRLLQENSKVIRDGASIPVYSSTDGRLVENYPVDIVSSRSISGTFNAKDGLYVAVGGLIEESEREKINRIPVLGRIPLLGFLFRSTEKEKSRSELIVLIRPHVINTPAEGEEISRKLLDQLSAHPAKDGRANIGIMIPDSTSNTSDDTSDGVEENK
jgi:general secretion pathway protein D